MGEFTAEKFLIAQAIGGAFSLHLRFQSHGFEGWDIQLAGCI